MPSSIPYGAWCSYRVCTTYYFMRPECSGPLYFSPTGGTRLSSCWLSAIGHGPWHCLSTQLYLTGAYWLCCILGTDCACSQNLEFSSKKKRVWENSKYTSVQRFHITWHKGLNPWNPLAERTALYFWMVFHALGLLQVHLRCSTRMKGWKRQRYLRVPGK